MGRAGSFVLNVVGHQTSPSRPASGWGDDARPPGRSIASLRDDVESTAPAQRLLSSTDDALVQRAAGGDVAAFEALMAGRLDTSYRLAWSGVTP